MFSNETVTSAPGSTWTSDGSNPKSTAATVTVAPEPPPLVPPSSLSPEPPPSSPPPQAAKASKADASTTRILLDTYLGSKPGSFLPIGDIISTKQHPERDCNHGEGSRPNPGTRPNVSSPVTLSDESLLAGLASGDAEAAAQFVRRFQGRVYGLAVAILGDRGVAEEAAQEAFVRAWRHGDAYDRRRGSVATWLLTIARNVAIDIGRMKRPEPIDPDALLAWGPIDDEMEEREMLAHDSRRLVAELRRLPEEQRRALVLAAFYGRTGSEIADLEGVPLGTVKTRVRTAMLKLRAQMESRDE